MQQGIDSHALVISRDSARYPLAPLGPVLAPGELDALPEAPQLLAWLAALGLEGAILVQRTRAYGFDNSYICDQAAQQPLRLRAVCAIDARDPRCAEQVAYWLGRRGGCGIRLMEPVKGADLSWLGADADLSVWRAASDLDVPVAVHFFPWNRAAGLDALARVLRELPRLTVVLDGMSGIAVEAGPPGFGSDDRLRRLAQFERVCVKLTNITLGRTTEAGELARCAIRLFGAERVMWGSDLVSASESYSGALERAREAAASLTAYERDCLLGATARRLYLLSGG